jgi:hypothetical protein
MAYIGNTVQNQGFTPAIDYFNGDGVTVTFTLSRPVASVAQLIVAIDNVIQNPSTAFSVSGNSITFTSAPLSGTNNIWVEYTSLITTYSAISQDPSVIGDISATGGYLAEGDFGNTFIDGTIVDYVTGTARITTGPSDAITLYNGGTSARNPLMTLAATGNVGIGTASPVSDARLTISSPTTESYVFFNRSNSGVFDAAIGNNGGSIVFRGGADSATVAGLTEFMRIDSTGNVGIGTSSPLTPLHVVGSIQSQRSGAAQYARMLNSTGTATFISDNQASGAYTGFQFQGLSTASGTPVTYATIDGSGNLLVGTTSASYGARNVIQNNGTTTQPSISCINSTGSGTMRQIDFFTGSNTSRIGSIESTTSSTSFNTSSDYRLKNSIEPMTGALAKVSALKPVTYKWNIDNSDGQGFIAHELQAIVPDCVTGEKDAVETYTDEDGNEATRPLYQGVDTSFLVATLTASIQELKAIVDAQAARIAALEAK